jgi:hypothetical protein
MANIVKGTAKTVARSPSERRIGLGFTLLGGGAAGIIALASLIWPTVLHPIPLFVFCGLVCASGVAMVLHSGLARTPQPNLSIAWALDYLVNDSTAVLEQDPPPAVAAFGPAKGQVLVSRGKPHEDALKQIEQHLGLGTLTAFGCRAQAAGDNPGGGFDSIVREIPKDYWDVGGLHPLFARIPESAFAQTYLRSSGGGHSQYSDIMLDRKQLQTVWRPKSVWRRGWDRLLRKPRIGDYLNDPMPTQPSNH